MHKAKPVPMPPADRVILSVMEAAAVAGLGHNTIRKAIKEEKLPARKIGKRVLIRRIDLEQFLSPPINPRSKIAQ